MASKAKFQAATTAFTSGVRNVLDYTRIALRFLQLQILSWKASLSKSTEEPKVAIYKDRKAALLHACLHLVPMSAALALMILNIRSYFVGGISPTKVTALQFSAKLLEILMQASLAAILFGLVRHELVGGRNLPLGSILAPLHITDISYLWSLNHWGSLTSQDPRGWRKLSLLVIIPATIILAALVGPSSAVLMIPRPISYLYGKELDFTDEAATSFTTDEGLPGGHLL